MKINISSYGSQCGSCGNPHGFHVATIVDVDLFLKNYFFWNLLLIRNVNQKEKLKPKSFVKQYYFFILIINSRFN